MKVYEVSYNIQRKSFVGSLKGKRAVWASDRLNAIESCVNYLFQSFKEDYFDCCVDFVEDNKGRIRKAVFYSEGEMVEVYTDFKTKFFTWKWV